MLFIMWKISGAAAALLLGGFTVACNGGSGGDQKQKEQAPIVVDLLTSRYFQEDQALFDQYAERTGLVFNVTRTTGDSLADFFEPGRTDLVIARSVADLNELRADGRLAVFSTPGLDENIGSYYYRDKDGYWVGLTRRAAAFVYRRDAVDPGTIAGYQALTDDRWQGELIASAAPGSPAVFITAALLADGKTDAARAWAAGLAANRRPDSPDDDMEIIRAVAGGAGKVGLIFAPSHILLHMSGNPESFRIGENTGVVFPVNREGMTYTDLSCAALAEGTPVRKEVLAFLEFLTSTTGQEPYARTVHEYPVNALVLPSDFTINLGGYREARVEPFRVAGQYPAARDLLQSEGYTVPENIDQ